MQQHSDLLNIREFFSICHQLVLEAGNQIKTAYETQSIVSKKKALEEEFTDFDLKIQSIYVNTFKYFWPKLKIVAEETEEYPNPIEFNYKDLAKDTLPSNIFEGHTNTDISLDNAILWIDPIDGTSEFIKGKKNGVTSLIGLSVNGIARLGVVGKYFDKKENEDGVTYDWNPRCYFADAEFPHFYVLNYLNENKISEVTREKESKEKEDKLIYALVYFDDMEIANIKKSPRTEIKLIEGGEVLSVADQGCDVYVYRGSGYYMKWDICAGDAIMRCLGGCVTDPRGNTFTYHEEQSTWEVSFGQIISRSKEALKVTLEILNSESN